MSARAGIAATLLSVAALGAADTLASRTWWIQAFPADVGELALRETVQRVAGHPAPDVAAALAEVAREHDGTVAAGLASLGAGLVLLDAGRHSDAISHLRDDDLRRTALPDHALMALGRAQEVLQQPGPAIESYLKAADAVPRSTLVCPALFRAAELQKVHGRLEDALTTVRTAYGRCETQRARALLVLGLIHEQRNDVKMAAAHYHRVEAEHPETLQAIEVARHLARLRPKLPPEPAGVRTAREMKRALAVFDVGRHADAVALLRNVFDRASGEDKNLVRVRLGRALLTMGKPTNAHAYLSSVPATSAHHAEAVYGLGRVLSAQGKNPVATYERVVEEHPASPWAEEALLSAALWYQKDARHDAALPYYQQMLERFPDGENGNRAAWYAGYGDYRHGRYQRAAEALERAARLRPPNSWTAAELYWAGKARQKLGQEDAARQDFQEAVVRYKHTWHGILAQQALDRLPPLPGSQPPGIAPLPSLAADEIPVTSLRRLEALLLIDRLDEAMDELKSLPRSPKMAATISWIEWRRGNLRPAITWMKRAYPEHVSSAGDRLPENVWRILYPLEHADALLTSALAEELDPALVAALVCQESTFQKDALSRVGAKGLMQLMPRTASELARSTGVRLTSLFHPEPNLRLGSRYLAQNIRQFDGRVERALAAYNAGPTRVRRWTSGRPDMPADEFVELVPFQETRHYVMTILTSREQYRWIYGLDQHAAAGAAAAP